ncbi:hypothetical protein AGDE_07166 [Angomonas deanei]|nr:hypothetical protein AGDE_07166 [Angomonas deanei]|eukprot:EPY35933.1 hypothetical protein AGDE_07166 [Angomonas deanei]
MLVTAAGEGVTPVGGDSKLNSSARSTSVAIVTRPDIRGVRNWAVRHTKECPKCAATFSKVPPTEPYNYLSKATGVAASPDLTKVQGKRFHRVTARIVKENSLEQRMDERSIELFRCVMNLKIQTKEGTPFPDPATTATELATLINRWIEKSIKAAQENVRTKAAWNLPGSQNGDLSAAVDLLIYSIVPKVTVQSVGSLADCTVFSVRVVLSAPLQISVIDPLIQLLKDSKHRDYVAQYLWEPIASWIGDAIGIGDVLRKHTNVGMKFIDGLYEIYNRMSAKSGGSTMEKLFQLARALATYGSLVAVDVSVPSLVEELQSVGAAKRGAIGLAKALLQNVMPPSPLTLPPRVDQQSLDLNIRLLRVPTGILEVLNNKFSSNERLPSTSRTSVLDLVVTPKTKISVALKLYSELLIEVYRPYSAASGVASSLSTGSVPHCMPVIDLPIDTIKSNVALAKMAEEYRQKLDQLEQKEFDLEKNEKLQKGKETAKELLEKAGNSVTWHELKKEIESLQVKVTGAQSVVVDVALPFGLSVMDAVDTSRPILYGRLEYV